MNKKKRGELREILFDAWKEGPASQIAAAKRYVRVCPKDFDGWVVLADGLAGVARYSEAQKALRNAGRVVRKDLRWFLAVQWGHLYREKRDERRSEAWYRKALALRPGVLTHTFLGATLAKQGRFVEAKKHHRHAVRLADVSHPADEALFNLGLILRAEEKWPQAAVMFRRAIAIDPDYKVAREALADVEGARRLRAKLAKWPTRAAKRAKPRAASLRSFPTAVPSSK